MWECVVFSNIDDEAMHAIIELYKRYNVETVNRTNAKVSINLARIRNYHMNGKAADNNRTGGKKSEHEMKQEKTIYQSNSRRRYTKMVKCIFVHAQDDDVVGNFVLFLFFS